MILPHLECILLELEYTAKYPQHNAASSGVLKSSIMGVSPNGAKHIIKQIHYQLIVKLHDLLIG